MDFPRETVIKVIDRYISLGEINDAFVLYDARKDKEDILKGLSKRSQRELLAYIHFDIRSKRAKKVVMGLTVETKSDAQRLKVSRTLNERGLVKADEIARSIALRHKLTGIIFRYFDSSGYGQERTPHIIPTIGRALEEYDFVTADEYFKEAQKMGLSYDNEDYRKDRGEAARREEREIAKAKERETLRKAREIETKRIQEEAKRQEQLEQIRVLKERSKYYIDSCSKRGITELIHFTRIENLESIMKDGILPRNRLMGSGSQFIFNDEERYDGALHSSCLSITFPNSLVFWRFRYKAESEAQADKNTSWVVLSISPSIFNELGTGSIDDVSFYNENAARSTALRRKFSELFEKKSDDLPRNIQAEILVKGVIPPKYIQRVYVHPNTNIDKFSFDVPIESKLSMFKNREDVYGL